MSHIVYNDVHKAAQLSQRYSATLCVTFGIENAVKCRLRLYEAYLTTPDERIP